MVRKYCKIPRKSGLLVAGHLGKGLLQLLGDGLELLLLAHQLVLQPVNLHKRKRVKAGWI